MKKSVCILLIYIFSLTVYSQQVSNWKTYTNMSFVKDIAVSDNAVLGATTGGAFLYSFSDNSFRTLTKV